MVPWSRLRAPGPSISRLTARLHADRHGRPSPLFGDVLPPKEVPGADGHATRFCRRQRSRRAGRQRWHWRGAGHGVPRARSSRQVVTAVASGFLEARRCSGPSSRPSASWGTAAGRGRLRWPMPQPWCCASSSPRASASSGSANIRIIGSGSAGGGHRCRPAPSASSNPGCMTQTADAQPAAANRPGAMSAGFSRGNVRVPVAMAAFVARLISISRDHFFARAGRSASDAGAICGPRRRSRSLRCDNTSGQRAVLEPLP